MRFGIAIGTVLILAAVVAGSAENERPAGVYPLDHCIVSGKKLGDEPVKYDHEGRELRFCCGGCTDKFKADPASFLAKVDKEIIEQQRDSYPFDTCVIMPEDEIDPKLDFVYNNRLIRICCRDCSTDFNDDPAQYIALIDKAIVEKQKPTYALETCVVSGEKLGDHGEPVDYVLGGRLVRLCCQGCVASLEEKPKQYLSKLDKP